MGAALLVATLVATPVAFASEPVVTTNSDIIVVTTTDSAESASDTIGTEITVTSETAARAELKSLKQKEQDPSTGFFTRLIIGFKIKQLETQLNIKKALQ